MNISSALVLWLYFLSEEEVAEGWGIFNDKCERERESKLQTGINVMDWWGGGLRASTRTVESMREKEKDNEVTRIQSLVIWTQTLPFNS